MQIVVQILLILKQIIGKFINDYCKLINVNIILLMQIIYKLIKIIIAKKK
jgi:hypothetical protein